MASSSTLGSFFPSQTRRRTAELPELPALQPGPSSKKAVLPTDETPIVREGAQAALMGVNKKISQPTALQKARDFHPLDGPCRSELTRPNTHAGTPPT